MKKKVTIGIVLVIAMLWYVKGSWLPVKYAIKVEELRNYPNSILVWEAGHTGTGWEQIGTSEEMFSPDKLKDVYLLGNAPPSMAVGGHDRNIFLCEVRYLGKTEDDDATWIFEQYEVLEWHPLYPIKRDNILPSWFYPKGYFVEKDKIKLPKEPVNSD